MRETGSEVDKPGHRRFPFLSGQMHCNLKEKQRRSQVSGEFCSTFSLLLLLVCGDLLLFREVILTMSALVACSALWL
jgi:hypothetical protein